MPALIDMKGRTFGRLVVIARSQNDHSGEAKWVCECECGSTTVVAGSSLRDGDTRSCGCLQVETVARLSTTFGLRSAPEYQSVVHARSRCRNTRDGKYPSYGGRGIEYRLPENPSDASKALIAEIGRRPAGTSLDRIDNEGHYELGNVRWATPSQQSSNQRRRRSPLADDGPQQAAP